MQLHLQGESLGTAHQPRPLYFHWQLLTWAAVNEGDADIGINGDIAPTDADDAVALLHAGGGGATIVAKALDGDAGTLLLGIQHHAQPPGGR